MKIILELPLPNMALSPNRKTGHWTNYQKAKKADVAIGFWTAKNSMQGLETIFTNIDKIRTKMFFYRPTKTRADITNLIASYKSMEDGIFKAISIDDSQIIALEVNKLYDKANPRLIVILEKIE
jgi:Holliday junction resolvase RusA-like endonuclease